MVICVFDTEATSLEKPFCYNIGYVLYDTERKETILERDFVVEQVWHNQMLFSTAYYADKRPFYVNAMRSRTIPLMKFGHITQRMTHDFKTYNVQGAYAYNSSFDERVFDFNCDWFKCINPFDDVPIFDIRGYAHHFIVNDEYKRFCEYHKLFSASGNYSTTAEDIYRFLSTVDFVEDHTALSDSQIELNILTSCFDSGAAFNEKYSAYVSIPREKEKTLYIYVNKEKVFSHKYCKMRMDKDRTKINLTSAGE